MPVEVTSMHHRIINPKFAKCNTRKTVWGHEQESAEFASWQTVAPSTLTICGKLKLAGKINGHKVTRPGIANHIVCQD